MRSSEKQKGLSNLYVYPDLRLRKDGREGTKKKGEDFRNEIHFVRVVGVLVFSKLQKHYVTVVKVTELPIFAVHLLS